MKQRIRKARKRELDLDAAFKRLLNVYLPVALQETNADRLYKLYSKVNRVLEHQPISDVTAVLAITLGDAVNYWHKKDKESLRKQRKVA